jgi:aryl sulfotransferase
VPAAVPPSVRYRSDDDDSARWDNFPFRDGDIVISTRSKTGTTWVQMICALLVFQTTTPPAALSDLSPWLDHLVEPRDDVVARLEAQPHRRFIKTHTPLDGIPVDPRAMYLVTARHPLDMAVSLYHQGDNIDRERMRELTGSPAPASPPKSRPQVRDWLHGWVERDVSPVDWPDSLPGVLHHISDAWARRSAGNVVLVHYADLLDDLEGQMRRIADRLGIAVPEHSWPSLVEAATFASMRSRADELTPNTQGVLKDNQVFFRRGSSGAGRELLSDQEMAHYLERADTLAEPDILEWLHR